FYFIGSLKKFSVGVLTVPVSWRNVNGVLFHEMKANLEKSDLDPTLKAPKDRSMTKNVVLGRLTRILNPALDLKGKMEMSCQIQEYECLVNKLK
ncbi:hypothetical protein S245_012901, partial [Arachis hypogaea]